MNPRFWRGSFDTKGDFFSGALGLKAGRTRTGRRAKSGDWKRQRGPRPAARERAERGAEGPKMIGDDEEIRRNWMGRTAGEVRISQGSRMRRAPSVDREWDRCGAFASGMSGQNHQVIRARITAIGAGDGPRSRRSAAEKFVRTSAKIAGRRGQNAGRGERHPLRYGTLEKICGPPAGGAVNVVCVRTTLGAGVSMGVAVLAIARRKRSRERGIRSFGRPKRPRIAAQNCRVRTPARRDRLVRRE